jgi:hypothetical protein
MVQWAGNRSRVKFPVTSENCSNDGSVKTILFRTRRETTALLIINGSVGIILETERTHGVSLLATTGFTTWCSPKQTGMVFTFTDYCEQGVTCAS